MRLPSTLSLSLFLPLLLVGCGDSSVSGTAAASPSHEGGNGKNASEAVLVKVGEVESAALSALYSTSATLRAAQQAVVTARTRGVIERLLAEEGDRVEAGDSLATLENEEQRIAAARSRALAEAKQAELERSRKLYEDGLLAEEVFETVGRDAQDAEHAAALAELELSRTAIRAPIRGVVMRRYLDVGNTVADGTAVYDIADVDPLFADVNVPERHVARLAAGQQVRLSADASGEGAAARIERIAPGVETSTGTVKVTLSVAATKSLRPGSFVRVDIVTDTHLGALVVPRSALVAEGRRWYLYRVQGEGTSAGRLEVALGFEEGELVEVIPAGDATLSVGDRVVVAGAGSLSDGAAIEVEAEQPPDDGDVRS